MTRQTRMAPLYPSATRSLRSGPTSTVMTWKAVCFWHANVAKLLRTPEPEGWMARGWSSYAKGRVGGQSWSRGTGPLLIFEAGSAIRDGGKGVE